MLTFKNRFCKSNFCVIGHCFVLWFKLKSILVSLKIGYNIKKYMGCLNYFKYFYLYNYFVFGDKNEI